MRRRGIALTSIVVAAATLVLAWSQTWFVLQLSGEPLEIGGDAAAPAVLALALTLLALVGVLAIAGPRLRVGLGVIVVLVGAGSAVVAGAVVLDPSAVFERAVGDATGIGGAGALALIDSAASTAWPLVAIAGGVAAAAIGIGVVLRSRAWPASGRRYEVTAAGEAPRDAVETWDSMSRGDDPTDGHERAPETDRLPGSDDEETERP